MTKGMRLEDAAKNLNVSGSTLKHNLISQSRPNATPTIVDQKGITQLNFDTLPSEQGLAATADSNSFVVKEIPKSRARPDEHLGNHEVEAVGMVGEETREVSRSTLKRSCREYGIQRWPPRKKHKISCQSCPNESPMFIDQERITQLNSDALPTSNQVLTNTDTTSVTVKARYGNETIIKFRLSKPWGMVKLEGQVKKRLAGTFDIKYKDEDNEWILIACDEDLQDCISSSRPQGPTSIEVLLVPK
ncbi:hypothetical protein RHMOL_Rhmol02G0042500 [Rhododendron molle]|uniref:Uncharacterized protein n=1 Tax=Rhododendron molle TaxID=49168 RepID=A0ACC0PMV4_RHOML|nr:hypothetical protein RHMOL_Rhmol02G0042500 [Rhododendron molle]